MSLQSLLSKPAQRSFCSFNAELALERANRRREQRKDGDLDEDVALPTDTNDGRADGDDSDDIEVCDELEVQSSPPAEQHLDLIDAALDQKIERRLEPVPPGCPDLGGSAVGAKGRFRWAQPSTEKLDSVLISRLREKNPTSRSRPI